MKLMIFFIIGIVHMAWAQSPGNVTWSEIHVLSPGSDDSALYGSELFNFHPYRMFDQPDETWSIPTSDLDQVSAFIVFSSFDTTHVFKIDRRSISTFVSDSTLVSYDTITYKETKDLPKFMTYIEYSPYAEYEINTNTLLQFGSLDQHHAGFSGGLAEVILYPYLLDTDQRNRVETYLSLKYGISLPDSSNYYRSDGDSIWVATNHPIYRNRVTGIGRDDQGALYQKQSHNLYGDIDLTFGLETIEEYNNDNAASLADLNFLMWADDDEPLEFIPIDPQDSLVTLLERTWEAFAIGGDVRNKSFMVKIDTAGLAGFDPSLELFFLRQSNAGIPFSLANCDYYPMISDVMGQTYSCAVTFDGDQTGSDLFGFYQQPASSSLMVIDSILCTGQGAVVNVLVDGKPGSKMNLKMMMQGDIIKESVVLNGHTVSFRDLKFGTYELVATNDYGKTTRNIVNVNDASCLNSQSIKLNASLAPNPVSSGQPFRFDFTSSEEDNLTVSIYGSSGNLIRKKLVHCEGHCFFADLINISGTYMIKVEGESGYLEVFSLVVIE